MKKALLSITLLGLFTGCSPSTVGSVLDALNNGKPSATPSSTPSTTATTVPSSSNPVSTTPTETDLGPAIAAFQSEFEIEGKSYKGAIKMLFKALVQIESNPTLAEHLTSLTLNGKQMYENAKSPTGYDIGSSARFMLTEMKNKPEVVLSYIGGTTEKNYSDADKVNLPISYPTNGTLLNGLKVDNTIEAAGAIKGRVYIQSAGKDFPTPIYLEQNAKGLWKINVSDLSSIATGVKKAAKTDF
ncbi:MAG: hypothetical protein AB7I41_19645 [Candidatus Sericytochromatia bacterium]